jgi:hypothetical protein
VSDTYSLIGNKANSTVEDLSIVHPVIAVRNTARTIDVSPIISLLSFPALLTIILKALSILFENKVHGVAVVEHLTSKLIANLSASDLRVCFDILVVFFDTNSRMGKHSLRVEIANFYLVVKLVFLCRELEEKIFHCLTKQ